MGGPDEILSSWLWLDLFLGAVGLWGSEAENERSLFLCVSLLFQDENKYSGVHKVALLRALLGGTSWGPPLLPRLGDVA